MRKLYSLKRYSLFIFAISFFLFSFFSLADYTLALCDPISNDYSGIPAGISYFIATLNNSQTQLTLSYKATAGRNCEFTDHDLDLLGSVSGQIFVSIENSQLLVYESSQVVDVSNFQNGTYTATLDAYSSWGG